MIKESIKTSYSINQLSWFAEVMFYRLLLSADDYGCCDGRPVVLRNTLFPTRDDVTTAQITKALDQLKKVRIVFEYSVNGKQYLCFPNFTSYQRLRAKSRKYPAPPEDLLKACQSDDSQMTDTCLLEEELEVELEVELEEKKENKKEIIDCEVEGSGVSDADSEASKSQNGTSGEVEEIIDYLNSEANTRYSVTDSYRKLINGRLREKYTVNDFKTVINKKCDEWLGTDMAKFLRPNTLFAKSHFDEYLNAPQVQKRNSVPMPAYWYETEADKKAEENEITRRWIRDVLSSEGFSGEPLERRTDEIFKDPEESERYCDKWRKQAEEELRDM